MAVDAVCRNPVSKNPGNRENNREFLDLRRCGVPLASITAISAVTLGCASRPRISRFLFRRLRQD
jgi:hypothetical protein